MSLPPDEIGAIAKAFPHIRAKHITAALGRAAGAPPLPAQYEQLATIFSLAEQLDGLPRHVAMHPCGVLLSDRTLLDRTAVQASAEGFPLSHLDKDDAEIAGVIKLDVLGVRMQSAMAHTLAEIERTTAEKIDIDAMPRDDEPTYAMIGRSDTLGCFQIESPGQRELVKKLAPRDVADLIVDISLFRPGPVNSDMITPFLRTRHGLAEPRYPDEKLREALQETGGVVVFHEQVLRIIDVMTGCGLAEADLVRRHLSAPGGPERTAPWFRAKADIRGFDPETIERVWEVVSAFGGFGFCKAHAAAFAIPVYQSAWLKRHHPAAFYAGVLTHDPGMYPKRVIIGDARLSGVQVLPVDVNASSGEWRTEKAPADGPAPDDRRPPRWADPVCPGATITAAADRRCAPGHPLLAPRGQGHQRRRGRAHRHRPALHQPARLLGPRQGLPPGRRAPGPHRRLRLPLPPRPPRPPPRPPPSRDPVRNFLPEPGGAPAPTRRDLLARVGVLARQTASARQGTSLALDLFASADTADGMADLVPAGELRELDLAERVEAELEILGFDVSQHVIDFYADLLAGLNVVRSADLDRLQERGDDPGRGGEGGDADPGRPVRPADHLRVP